MSASLSIAMLSYHTCPLAAEEGKETGGMNVYVLELSKQLVKLGHRVDIFTRCQDPSNPAVVEISPGLRLFHVLAGPPANVPKQQLVEFIPEFADRVNHLQAQQSQPYDLIHAHYYQSGLVAQQLKTLGWSQPLLMTFHTLALLKNLVARTAAEQESTARIEVEYDLVKTADAIVTPSASDREYLLQLYGASVDKVHIIPPGVDIELFKPMDQAVARQHIGAPIDEKLLLFVGRIEPLKGVDASLYALKMVKHRHPDCQIRLWIVGGEVTSNTANWSAELKKLEQLRHTLQIADLVQFEGQQPQSALPYYYNAASIVVMPSHYESFGMAVLEAMACGVPVVTTNVAGISQWLEQDHEHLLATVNDPVGLSQQIEAILQSDTTQPELRSKLRQIAVQLAWPAVAGQMLQLYERML